MSRRKKIFALQDNSVLTLLSFPTVMLSGRGGCVVDEERRPREKGIGRNIIVLSLSLCLCTTLASLFNRVT